MFLSIFIHFNYLFQTITQSFYIVLSHINIRTRNKISAGVLIIRRRNNYTRGRASQKIFEFFRNLTVPKIVAQCRKHPIPYLNTCLTYLNTSTRLSAPYLNTCIAYLNTLSRLSAPYLNTSIAYLNTLSRLSVPYLNTCITYLNTLGRLSALGSIS